MKSTSIQISNVLGVALIGFVFFTVLGTQTDTTSFQLVHNYGNAFTISLEFTVSLATATLILVSFLLLSRQHRADADGENTLPPIILE